MIFCKKKNVKTSTASRDDNMAHKRSTAIHGAFHDSVPDHVMNALSFATYLGWIKQDFDCLPSPIQETSKLREKTLSKICQIL